MFAIKRALEKPTFVWFLVVCTFFLIFLFSVQNAPLQNDDDASYQIVHSFGDSSFPPKISLIRELPDWGHLGYYTLMGRMDHALKGSVPSVRMLSLCIFLLALFFFVRICRYHTDRNRMNPMWSSAALLILVVNPYMWKAAFHIHFLGMLLLFLFLALWLFEKENLSWASFFVSLGVLIDWRSILLAVAFVLARAIPTGGAGGTSGKILRPERILALASPFIVGTLPILAWHGFIPQGEARQWWQLLKDYSQQHDSSLHFFQLDGLFYAFVLLPIYGLFFIWTWGIRARVQALKIGAIISVACIPFYFIFPQHFASWAEIRFGNSGTVGLIDQLAEHIAGQYKQGVLFLPWLAGVFFFIQLFFMDVLDSSRVLRFFIVLFFAVQPFVVGFAGLGMGGVGDEQFIAILPFVLIFSLSEALIGEQGKLV